MLDVRAEDGLMKVRVAHSRVALQVEAANKVVYDAAWSKYREKWGEELDNNATLEWSARRTFDDRSK